MESFVTPPHLLEEQNEKERVKYAIEIINKCDKEIERITKIRYNAMRLLGRKCLDKRIKKDDIK